MPELSESDLLYINVGKCLTSWNRIEEEVLGLVSYCCSLDWAEPMELSVGYWAVVSFEARLKWCSSVTSLRTRGTEYSELNATWRNLDTQLTKKAKQRAKVAHGSVVGFIDPKTSKRSTYLIPYFHAKQTQFNTLPHTEAIKGKFTDFAETVTAKDLSDMRLRFETLRTELWNFRLDLRGKDIETGRLELNA